MKKLMVDDAIIGGIRVNVPDISGIIIMTFIGA